MRAISLKEDLPDDGQLCIIDFQDNCSSSRTISYARFHKEREKQSVLFVKCDMEDCAHKNQEHMIKQINRITYENCFSLLDRDDGHLTEVGLHIPIVSCKIHLCIALDK